MSVATAATSTKRQIRSSLRRWRGDLDEEQLPLFRDFVTDILGRLRGPFLAHHHAKQVLEHLESAFRLTLVRDQEAVKIQMAAAPSKGVVILCNMNDQPFVVDTIRLFLRKADADYWGGFSMVFHATRDEQGRLVTIGAEDGAAESLVLAEADGGGLGNDLDAAAEALQTNLSLSRAMVEDFRAMTRVVDRFIDKLEVRADRHPEHSDRWVETAAFLKWLLRENFVFMGVDAGDEPLGIQRVKSPYYGTPEGDWPPPHPPETVQVRKSRIESTVHRAGRIDEVLVRLESPSGEVERELFIRGMFTYRAVTQPCRNVPILRQVLAGILEEAQSKPGSFRYKGIANVFDSLPTEFLFTASRQAIAETVDLVFETEQQHEVGVSFLMTGPHSSFCLVAMPKSQFGDELRRSLEEHLVSSLKATYSDHGLFVGRYDTVLLYYFLTGVEPPGEDGLQQLIEQMREMATPWPTRLWRALAKRFDEASADRLTEIYGRSFPDEWTRQTRASRAVKDIGRLESLSETNRLVADVFEDKAGILNLRLYEGRDVYLSDVLPILDDFGLVVLDSYSTDVRTRGGTLFMDTFRLAGARGIPRTEFRERKDLLQRALEQVFADQVGSDTMNRLVLAAGLSWSEVDMLRGYVRYSRQFQLALSFARITELLLSHPHLCVKLVRLFHARFDPDLEDEKRGQIVAKALERLDDALRLIITHDEDLIFSSLRDLIDGTVRTNFYRDDRKFHYLSFKVDCSKIRIMGARRPMFEIYVHNKDVEGAHLRFGKIARGGLRWSDRDDYRTEVLGLATTQVVKNVVIVPVGAKGGFYLKNASRDPATRRQQADQYYQTFIRGLLDLTDNRVDDQVVPPPRVVRHDADDPYLVVAADKGTAHLSDTANALSKEYGYWLGDAFASGGSQGYDHKKVGITARGTWVLVTRHFLEMGRDPYSEPCTCAGIGDMGGDVFGNGLIETPHMVLLAAFNHLHIFLDPNPDPKTTYEERVRLFKAGRKGGWDHYDQGLISEGGGVFERSAKSLPLSPQVQEMLGLEQEEAQPEEVIRHILMMDVDVFWNGGIGTYVKASTETHPDADDRSNDALRVDANQLRCKIIGEGGNLGLTQKGRIEAGFHGVALNTDFIDNSGGVDMSDHEVNLKILVNRIVARGEITEEERNGFLETMTAEIAQLVLANSFTQGRQISRDRIRSRLNIFHFGRAIEFVVRFSGRSRKALDLPTGKELARRAELGLDLSRPELSVLSSFVKMYVFQALMDDGPKNLPGYDALLTEYFPGAVQERYPDEIRAHMLADEIAATMATTRIVADAGAAYIPIAIETTGRSVLEICSAYLKAQVLSKAAVVRTTLERLRTEVALNDLAKAWVSVDEGTKNVAAYWLSARERPPTDAELQDMLISVDEVYKAQASEVRLKNEDLLEEILAAQIPEEVATRVLKARYLNTALMVWAEAKKGGIPVHDMAIQNLAVGRATGLQKVLDDISTRAAVGRWDPIALSILHRQYSKLLRATVLNTPLEVNGQSVDELAPYLRTRYLSEIRSTVDELLEGEEGPPSVATLVVLRERLEGVLGRFGVK
jgi:glutamate dehydrogenase